MTALGRTTAIVTAVVALAAAVAVRVALSTGVTSGDQYEAAVFFSLAAFIAHRFAYSLPRGGFGDITFVPLLAGVAVSPRLSTVLGAGVAVLFAAYLRRREAIKVVFNAAQLTLSTGIAVVVYLACGGHPLRDGEFGSALPFVAAFAAFSVSNAACFASVVAVSSGERFSAVLSRSLGGSSLVYDIVGIPIVFVFAVAYVKIGWVWSGVLLLPLAAVRQIYKGNRELQTVNEELLQLMVAAIEARDPYTSGHSQRVAAYSEVVANAVGLSGRGLLRVRTAALLHDVGKIHGEFDPILRKPDRLSDAEYAIMKSHAEKGARLVARVSRFADLVPAIRGHHEAWDGTGYPDALKGDAIPLAARIIAIADTIDAMTTDRPYRARLGASAVRDELYTRIGQQFDPRLVASLLQGSAWQTMERAIATHEPVQDAAPEKKGMVTTQRPRSTGMLTQSTVISSQPTANTTPTR